MDSDFNRGSWRENARQTSSRGISPAPTIIHRSANTGFSRRSNRSAPVEVGNAFAAAGRNVSWFNSIWWVIERLSFNKFTRTQVRAPLRRAISRSALNLDKKFVVKQFPDNKKGTPCSVPW